MAELNVMLGCDPEAWLFDRESNQPVSAYGLVPGTKARPHPLEKGMVQVDGMAIEFGIEPARTEDEFVNNIRTVLAQVNEIIPKELKVVFQPVVNFSKEVMSKQPDEALELGCEPDFSAYTLLANPRPTPPATLRSAGGHVHVGWGSDFNIEDPALMKSCAALAGNMDWYLGVPSLSWDSDTNRRRLYGAPGAFRPKPYGMEYRSLSNMWVCDENLQRFVFRNTMRAVEDTLKGVAHSVQPKIFFQGAGSFDIPAIIMDNWFSIGEAMFRGEEDVNV